MPISRLDKSTEGFSAIADIEMAPKIKICNNTFQSAEDAEINNAIDPGLWIAFSTADMAYWVDGQHHDGTFDKSCRTFAKGKPTRYCSQKLSNGINANGEQYKRKWLLYCSPSTGRVNCFVCELFVTKGSTLLADKDRFSDWREDIIIDNHEQSATHRDSMFTYLTFCH